MRMTRWLTMICLCAGVTTAWAQPPKANPPRSLPETQATALPEKSSTGTEEKPAVSKTPALIKVKVPDNATIWFENQKMSQPGAVRIFQSPTLEAKKTYYYKVKVTWPTGSGTLAKEVVSEQEVAVRAGETTTIDFTALVAYTNQANKPTSTRDMIRQAAHSVPAPDRNAPNK
ncbi:MAG TPA: TIGR03000 domain-containing protein [Gemmatales bacterium]|nr:TIGR03000 domain-containing protein [Gemmatales bacterium]